MYLGVINPIRKPMILSPVPTQRTIEILLYVDKFGV